MAQPKDNTMVVYNIIFALNMAMAGGHLSTPFVQETWTTNQVSIPYAEDEEMFIEVCSDEATLPKFAQTLDCSDKIN